MALTDSAQEWVKIAVAVLVVAITLVVLLLFKRRRVLQRGVCLVGLCDSGKTQLFSRLVFDKKVDSFTSMQENIGQLDLQPKKPLTVVDIPGHERVRSRFFDAHKSSARGLVFVVDSLNFTKDLRDVAEYLYSILLDPVVNSNRPAVLVLCNKQDHALAKGVQVVKTQLEKEMNLLRSTKTKQLEATSGDTGADTFLGRPGKDFEFGDLQPQRIDFAACSAGAGETDQLVKWLRAIA